LIGLIGTFGAVYLSDFLRTSREEEKHNLSNKGTFTDERDGEIYTWVHLKDGKKWMSKNLNFEMNDSWCYDDKLSNCATYGRLYTWHAALSACPEGWRLPTDDEWWEMTSYYGGAYSGLKNNIEENSGKAAYKALVQDGNSGFDVLFGGYRYIEGNFLFRDFGHVGNYWSSTGSNPISYA